MRKYKKEIKICCLKHNRILNTFSEPFSIKTLIVFGNRRLKGFHQCDALIACGKIFSLRIFVDFNVGTVVTTTIYYCLKQICDVIIFSQ